jgi:transcriptional regulator with XRE-family HTH domain
MEMSVIHQAPAVQTLSFRALLIIILQKIKISIQDLRKKGVSPTIMEEFLKGELRSLTTGVVDNLEKNLPLSAYGKDCLRETYQTDSITLTNQEIERMFARGGNSGNNYAPRDERQVSNQEKLRAAKSSREFMVELREQLELSKHEMALMIGVAPISIIMIEEGKLVVAKRSVEKVIDEFDIHPRVAAVFRNLAECDREEKKKPITYVRKPRPVEQRPQRFYQEKSLAFKKPGSDMPDFLKDVSKEKLTVFTGQIEGRKGGIIMDVEKKKEEPQEKAVSSQEECRNLFGNLIKRYRTQRKLSGDAIGKALGIPFWKLSALERQPNSYFNERPELAEKFIEFFNLSQIQAEELRSATSLKAERKNSRGPKGIRNKVPSLPKNFIDIASIVPGEAEVPEEQILRTAEEEIFGEAIEAAVETKDESEAEQPPASVSESIRDIHFQDATTTLEKIIGASASESIRDVHLADANDTLKKTIGEIIRWERANCEWSQSRLAGKVGVTITEIDNIEKGIDLPEIRLLSRIMEEFQSTPREKYLLAMIYCGCVPNPMVVELKGTGAEFIMELFQIFGKGAFKDS